jgi:hypothetical protein
MKFKTITFRKVKNLGNYETEALEVSVELHIDEDEEEAFYNLRDWVYRKLNPVNPEDSNIAF